jgi:Mrp family chromosome partitioning ATPase
LQTNLAQLMRCTASSDALYPPFQGSTVARSYSAASGSVKNPSIPGVKDIIAVASGKGGVGKSTTAGLLPLHSWN